MVLEELPFDLPSDPDEQKALLVNALRIVEGFALYFAVSDPAHVRPAMMNETEAALVGKTVQRIAVPKGTDNLLHLLQAELTDPLPDVVFVYGLENIISGAAHPRSHPLLLNLNATRNNLYALLPRPLVLWVPPFVIKATLGAAPDFISVRSGVYTFSQTADERHEMTISLLSFDQTEILCMKQGERQIRIDEMQHLLLDLRSLPEDDRKPLDEAVVLHQLALAYQSFGLSKESTPRYEEALSIFRVFLSSSHDGFPTVLNNVAQLYTEQGRYNEAEALFKEALSIQGRGKAKDNQSTATLLNNLGGLYKRQWRYKEAEAMYEEALSLRQDNLHKDPSGEASSLNNLALLYSDQDRYTEAEPLFDEALSLRRVNLPEGHPDIANSLNNMAGFYRKQGRYAEAESLYAEALQIMVASIGEDYSYTKLVGHNLELLHGYLKRRPRTSYARKPSRSQAAKRVGRRA